MGACCTSNDAMPEGKAARNTEESPNNSHDPNQPLIDTSDTKESLMEREGMIEMELNTSTIIKYILSPQITTFDLIDIWKKIDIHSTDEINIESELQNIFSIFIDRYIEEKIGKKTRDTLYIEKAQLVSKELSDEFNKILLNYEYNKGNIMTKEFFLDNFQKYFGEPNAHANINIISTPDTIESIHENNDENISIDIDNEITTEETEDIDDIKNIEIEDTFDMLTYISTSPTITQNTDALNEILSKLESAMKISKKIKRGEEIGSILSSLTVGQRLKLREMYSGTSGSLVSDLENNFSGDLLNILLELINKPEINDIEWIERSRNKLNINTSVINEILMSRCNSEINLIKREYFKKYGVTLLDSLLKSFNDSGSYGSLLKLILTDNNKILRKEFNPKYLKYKKIKDDAKILYHILENTHNKQGKLNKLKIIEMFCHRSWYHIQILSKEYGKKSKYDLKTMIEKKFGKNSKSGDALQKIIDISRNKHLFFANLLFQSMKGISVNHSQLIRIIIGRSSIDLGEISYIFTEKYGNGKTLLQFIKSNITRGTYRNILLNILQTIDDDVYDDDVSDTEHTIDDIKTFENDNNSISICDNDNDNDNDKHDGSPTIYPLTNFNSNLIATELIQVMTNKKKGKNKAESKKLLIQTLTMISNKQRQELKKSFFELHPNSIELSKATQETLRKGKTMIVMLGLLQRPSEFNCFWIKQSIKSKKIELLIEILVSLTNYEIQKLKEYYYKNENKQLLDDINSNLIGNNKNTAKYLIIKILECRRPEPVGGSNSKADKKLCKIHLTEMNKLLKQKNQKKCKQFFSKLFVENSYIQIKYEINKFNNASEMTLNSVVKKIMGNGISGIIIENIIRIATNKFEFFAKKLKESMRGITINEQNIIRILIHRSEKDLSDILEYFNENIDIGEGKTFKQWIKNALKGSFRTSLLRIGDCISDNEHGDGDNNDDDIEDYESQTESDIYTQLNNTHSPTNYNNKLPSSKSNIILPNMKRHATSPIPNIPKSASPKPKIIVSSPEQVEKEINNSHNQNNNIYNPYDVNEKEFGQFILEKVNEKTAQRLMQHLKNAQSKTSSSSNEDDNDIIKASQCIHVLLFACVLFLKYKEKTEKKPEIQIDKKKLKKSLMPGFNWMLQNKLKNNKTVKKSQYKILGQWLQEYYKTK